MDYLGGLNTMTKILIREIGGRAKEEMTEAEVREKR